MPSIIPFKGLLYNKEKIKDLRLVVTPPYDVITMEAQEGFYKRHEKNIIRVELGKIQPEDNEEENRYTRASRYLKDWIDTGTLIQDDIPAVYLYTLEYPIAGSYKRLSGFIALVKLEEPGKGRIFLHEETFSKHRTDRLNLLRACKGNLSPIFSLYTGENLIKHVENGVLLDNPRIDMVDDEGIRHKVWCMSDEDIIRDLTEKIKSEYLFIADGHHRYETALRYRSEMRLKEKDHKERPYDYVMMFLSHIEDEGITILPTHRILRDTSDLNAEEFISKARRYFNIETLPFTDKDKEAAEILNEMLLRGERHKVFGVYFKGGRKYYLLTLRDEGIMDEIGPPDRSKRWRRLDASVFQTIILRELFDIQNEGESEKKILYIKDPQEAIRRANLEDGGISFFLNPTKIKDVKEVSVGGEMMPHKSTYFYPKPLTGLVINSFNPTNLDMPKVQAP